MLRVVLALSLALPLLAQAYPFLTGYDEAPSLAAALERVKAAPQKHVLLYFDQSQFCPSCKDVRDILNSAPVRDKWQPNYVVVNIDLYAPTRDEREIIEQLRISFAPVLVFLNASGKRVAYTRQLNGERDANDMNEFVSKRQYAMSALGKYSTNLDPRLVSRAAAEPVRIDDKPRLRDVTRQPHERLTGESLRKVLLGKRMRKENENWFLTFDFGEKKLLEASGTRKDGRPGMKGVGNWYITKKGKLCVDLTNVARELDERWCRHVFRAGETYYVSKDLRPDRVVYRMVPDGG